MQMATYVIVHGAWSGAHGFRHVRKLLQAAGHQVYTPSLTGLGERVHLASPQVNLSTHVRDVVNHILYEDHRDIVLVGFSYGGFVVTGALEHIADRIRHLVYLDAFVPESGESLASHVHGEARPAIALGEPWLIPGIPREFDDPAEGEWTGSVKQPRAASARLLHRTRPSCKTAGGLPVHPQLHQGHRGRPGRNRQRGVLAGGETCASLEGLALLRDRDQPRDGEQHA
jgi:pimeloyl-ACP methyl ester carboxylesterase